MLILIGFSIWVIEELSETTLIMFGESKLSFLHEKNEMFKAVIFNVVNDHFTQFVVFVSFVL